MLSARQAPMRAQQQQMSERRRAARQDKDGQARDSRGDRRVEKRWCVSAAMRRDAPRQRVVHTLEHSGSTRCQ